MNRITFDRIVSSKPETYPFVTVPQEEEEVIPERGMPSCMYSVTVGVVNSDLRKARYQYSYSLTETK